MIGESARKQIVLLSLALSAFLVSNVREGSEALHINLNKLSKMHPV